jgi:tetratricopeptide (TPR) repeat protein
MDKRNSYHILALDLINQLKVEPDPSLFNPFWTEMTPDEREEFAEVLFDEGKALILEGESFAFHIFDLSRRISPFSAKLQFGQGVFLFDYAVQKCSEKYLLLAQKHIQHAIEIKSNFLDAWYIWGDILVHLGLVYKEAHYFQEAEEKYAKANQLCGKNPKYLKKFLWDWALCWYFLGKHSGEAIDVKQAIEKFDQTAKLGCNEPSFWRDYGNAWAEMGLLIRDDRFLEKALSFFEKALQLDPKYFDGWLSLAHTFQSLYQNTHQESYLAQAHSAYGKAAEQKQDHFELWLTWGNLFLFSGRAKEEIKHLQMSAMKYSKALKIEPKHPEVLSRWGEALVIIGTFTGRLDQLKLAESKILEALEVARECPDIWYRYGFNLYAQGQYFEDSDYYLMAIEKFNHALTLEKNHFYSLNGIGLTQFALGDAHKDESLLLLASGYFDKASKVRQDHPELWNNWGMTLMRLSDLFDSKEYIELAIEKFETALKHFKSTPPSTQLLYNYACALDFLGSYNEDAESYEKAAQILEMVLEKDPNYTPVYYNLALVYAHLGELLDEVDFYSKACENFHKAILEDPEDELIWNTWGMTLTHYARLIYEPLKIEFYEKLIEEAEKKLKQAIALGSLDAFYNLACLHCLAGNPNEALRYLQIAYQKDALPPIEQILYDDYLETLRNSIQFKDFVQNQLIKQKMQDK